MPDLLAEGRHTILRRELRDGRPVLVCAPRELPASADVLARMRYGATVAQGLDVPGRPTGVARVLAVEESPESPESPESLAIVLEDIGGITLRSVLAAGRLEVTEAVRIATQVARTLGALHERRVVHKSIEPSSILVNLETGEVRITSFEIASRLDREEPALAGESRSGASLAYVAPEQTGRMNRAVDYRADLYALGVTVYEMLSGRVPFADSEPAGLVQGHLNAAPDAPEKLRPSVPRALSEVVLKLLARHAEDRYQSAEGLVSDLNECLGHLVEGATLADFQLGKNDVTTSFQLPQQLYGRAAEREILVAALTRASRGAAEILVVSGPSGVGKTALVNELRAASAQEHGYFCAGACDPVRGVPYGALRQALGELVGELIGDGDPLLVGAPFRSPAAAAIRERIVDEVGPGLALLAEAIPALSRLVGRLPAIPSLGPAEARDRFDLAFQRLIGAFARREHPLAIFLDDLESADPASLRMLEILLRDPGGRHLLIVVAVNIGGDPSEGSGEARVARMVAAVRAGPAPVHELALGPLGEGEVARFVADAMGLPAGEPPGALQALVLRASGGNPLSLHQIFAWLQAAGLLQLDAGSGRWRCQVERLRGGVISGDVGTLFDARIAALPARTVRALSIAAGFGRRLELATLARAPGDTRRDAAADLWPAVEAGLIHPIGGAYRAVVTGAADPAGDAEYAFVHPRAHQAAYARIGASPRRELQLRAGRALLAETSPEERRSVIFDLADQLLDADPEPGEEQELARLDLLAGDRARRCNAFAAAARYLGAGLARLGRRGGPDPRTPGEDAWEGAYPLVFALHRDHAECAHLEGRVAEAEAELELVRDRAATERERVLVDLLQMKLASGRADFAGAVRTGCAALRRHGIVLPERDGLAAALAAEVLAVDAALAGLRVETILAAPVTGDADEHASVELLAHTLIAAAHSDLDRFRLAGAMIVGRSLRHGHAPFSALGYAAYGFVADPRGQQGSRPSAEGAALDLAGVARSLAERLDGPGVRATVQSFGAVFTSPWRAPLRESLEPLEQAHAGALAAGDLRVASFAGLQRLLLGLMSGEDLYRLQDLAGKYHELFLRIGRPVGAAVTASIQRTLLLLTRGPGGGYAPGPAAGGLPDEDEAALLAAMGGDAGAITCYRMIALQRAFLLEDRGRALEHAAPEEGGLAALRGHPAEAEHRYYAALALAAYQPSARATIEAHRDRLAVWAAGAPAAFLHRHLLVAAEAARLAGEDRQAMSLYERALESATEHQQPGGAALAAELAARYHLAAGRRSVARAYLVDARRAYARWGADGKVAELGRRHASLVLETSVGPTSGPRGPVAAPVDLAAVIRAAQAINRERAVSDLLGQLMVSALELAGAQRGFLVLVGEEQVVVEADLEDGAVRVAQRAGSFEDREDLPRSIVRRVAATRERVALEHAAAGGQFRSDPYVVRARPRSVLCLPLVQRERLLGVLYLENNRIVGAFTPDLAAVIELLAAQAAISLEHARVHDALARRVRGQEEELARSNADLAGALLRVKDAQKRLLVQEKLATLGGLTAGIAHEIKNPLNFINNFAESSVGIADELLDELRTQRARIDPDVSASLEELLGALRGNAAKINEHGRRADDIVRSMLEHSRGGSATSRAVDINALLKEYVNLAYQGFRSQDSSFNTSIEASYAPGLAPLQVVPQDLGRVFLNLVNNACYAVHLKKKALGRQFAPALRISTQDLGHAVSIRIHDNGPGIPAEVRDKMWSPFFTTKPTGDGTGLGLSISRDIVHGTGGTLEVETGEGQFTEFIITLPRKEAEGG